MGVWLGGVYGARWVRESGGDEGGRAHGTCMRLVPPPCRAKSPTCVHLRLVRVGPAGGDGQLPKVAGGGLAVDITPPGHALCVRGGGRAAQGGGILFACAGGALRLFSPRGGVRRPRAALPGPAKPAGTQAFLPSCSKAAAAAAWLETHAKAGQQPRSPAAQGAATRPGLTQQSPVSRDQLPPHLCRPAGIGRCRPAAPPQSPRRRPTGCRAASGAAAQPRPGLQPSPGAPRRPQAPQLRAGRSPCLRRLVLRPSINEEWAAICDIFLQQTVTGVLRRGGRLPWASFTVQGVAENSILAV